MGVRRWPGGGAGRSRLNRKDSGVNLVDPVRRCRYTGITLELSRGSWEHYKVTRRGLLILPLAIAMYAFALSAPAAQAGADADFIRKLGDEAIAVLGRTDNSLAEREAKFRTILKRSFDMPLIARFALGRHWRVASKEQRRDYLNLFTDYVVRSYAIKLGGYESQSLVIVCERRLKNKKDVLVNTRINRPSGAPIKTVWRVRTTKNRLRIIDVMVEGISMLVTHREEFSAVIRRHGVPGLLETLRARVGKLPATASPATKTQAGR